MLEKDENNKYRHYKGGIYYKLEETIITDNYEMNNIGVEVVGEATFEETCEPMLILSFHRGKSKVAVCFKDRESTASEFVEDVVLYQSEKDDKIWVRYTEVFNGYVFNDINDKSIKRFTKID